MSSLKGVLNGVKVLDLTKILAGPYCTMLLGDMGARVLKIERPLIGDDTRSWGPPFIKGESTYFLSVNRNKESITLDLKKKRARELVHGLVRDCDIVVENFKPGWAEKLGVDFESLRQSKPDLIYASITGFGNRGPDKDRLSYDVFVSAATGLMSITGEAAHPVKVGVAMTDLHTGALMANAITAALFHRAQTGRGQRIDTSLFETQLGALANVGSAALIAGVEPKRWGTAHASIVPYQAFDAKDRKFTCGALNDSQFTRLLRALNESIRSDDLTDAQTQAMFALNSNDFSTNAKRVESREILIKALSTLFQLKTAQEWQTIFDINHVPCCPINTVKEAFAMEQTKATHMIETVEHATIGQIPLAGIPVKFEQTPSSIRSAPPTLGQHTDSVLKEFLNCSDRDLTEWREQNII